MATQQPATEPEPSLASRPDPCRQAYDDIVKQYEREDDLISRRVSGLLLFEGLIFAAYGAVIGKSLEMAFSANYRCPQDWRLLGPFAFAALLMAFGSVAAYGGRAGIGNAKKQQLYLRGKYEELAQSGFVRPYLEPPGHPNLDALVARIRSFLRLQAFKSDSNSAGSSTMATSFCVVCAMISLGTVAYGISLMLYPPPGQATGTANDGSALLVATPPSENSATLRSERAHSEGIEARQLDRANTDVLDPICSSDEIGPSR
jgi:hypothetical protein